MKTFIESVVFSRNTAIADGQNTKKINLWYVPRYSTKVLLQKLVISKISTELP